MCLFKVTFIIVPILLTLVCVSHCDSTISNLISSIVMDMRNCCHSCRRTIMQFGTSCDETEHANYISAIESSKLKWKVLWMKLKKEKKKLFKSASPTLQVPPYDPYTYSQNFDQGTANYEPDNLGRSFTVRFADPSRGLVKKGVVQGKAIEICDSTI